MYDTWEGQGLLITAYEGGEDTIKIQAASKDSLEVFESDFVTLHRINIRTIFAALRQESSQIKYKLRKQKDRLEIQIVIESAFLQPFSQCHTLHKICEQKARTKILTAYMKKQVQDVESHIQRISQSISLLKETASFRFTDNNYLLEETLVHGNYLVQLSGLLTCDYVQYQSQMYLDVLTRVPYPIQVNIEENGKIKFAYFFNIYSGPEHSYEMPFNISFAVTLTQKGKVFLKQSKATKFSKNATLTKIISTVRAIK